MELEKEPKFLKNGDAGLSAAAIVRCEFSDAVSGVRMQNWVLDWRWPQ